MKKIIAFIVILALAVAFSVTSLAASGYVYDQTNTISAARLSAANDAYGKLSEKYGFDVFFVVINGTSGKSLQRYATDYYDEHCTYDDGAIFVYNTSKNIGEDEYNVEMLGFGKGKQLAKSYTIDSLVDQMSPLLNGGKYYEASNIFLSKCTSFVEGGFKADPRPAGQVAIRIVIAVLIGVIIAAAIVMSQKKKLTMIIKQRGAGNYMVRDKARITVERDMFLYSHTSRIRRDTDSGGGRGGSHSGTSGGGRSYSGGGRRI